MALNPQLAQKLNEGIAHHEAGRLDRAFAIYRQVATQAPRVSLVFDLLGRVTEQQGRFEDAIRYFRQALLLDSHSVTCAVQLASVLIATSRTPEAEKILRKLVTECPQDFGAWNSLGFVLKILGRMDEAVACHERAVTLNPKFAAGWAHWGLTLTLSGDNFIALDKFNRALELDPKLVSARYGRAQVLHKIYRTEAAIEDYDAVLAAEPGNLEARSYRLFALQTLESSTPERMLIEHRKYGAIVGVGPSRLPDYDYSPGKRLRVAILSPDFRTHSCAYFSEPLISRLDPTQFELYLYHDHFQDDAISARLKRHAAVWRNFVAQSAVMFERTVRADKPDILIDLTGHVGNTIRLPSFAKRLAPVQISYLGYPDTTGVAAMDFRFTDAIADPPGSDAFATEKLVRFAPVAWTYQPPAESPAVEPPPCAAGKDVVFGCFSSPTKFTDGLFAAWGKLLAALPTARLRLKAIDFEHDAVRSNMLERLRRNGVPLDRLELLPRTAGTAEHLAYYNRIDVVLDTFPYTGTTTTCEALWMGRPVISLVGNRHAARVGASLLTAVGHPEWAVTSTDEYVAIAAALVSRPDELQSTVMGLRAQLHDSPLMDFEGQSQCFAAALRQCWLEKATRTISRSCGT